VRERGLRVLNAKQSKNTTQASQGKIDPKKTQRSGTQKVDKGKKKKEMIDGMTEGEKQTKRQGIVPKRVK